MARVIAKRDLSLFVKFTSALKFSKAIFITTRKLARSLKIIVLSIQKFLMFDALFKKN